MDQNLTYDCDISVPTGLLMPTSCTEVPIDAYQLYRGATGSSAHILKFSLQLALFLLCIAMRILSSTFWFANFVFGVPKCEAVNFDKYCSACVNGTSISNSWHATYN